MWDREVNHCLWWSTSSEIVVPPQLPGVGSVLYTVQPVSEVMAEEKKQPTMELSVGSMSSIVAHLDEASQRNSREDMDLVASKANDQIGENEVPVGLPDRLLLAPSSAPCDKYLPLPWSSPPPL